MHRFFLSPQAIREGKVTFPADSSRQAARVLHLRPADQVVVLDNLGTAYDVCLTSVDDRSVIGEVTSQQPAEGEPSLPVHLYLSLCQREKFEWMLQKCTEVGASVFYPVITSRSLVQKKVEVQRKYDRWQKILQEAAEQAGRGRIPVLHPPLSFPEAVFAASCHPLVLMLWEGEQTQSLSQAVQPWKDGVSQPERGIGLFTGPEGGYSDEEVARAVRAGITPVTIGRRILRMETAAVVGTAFLLHDLDGMG